MQLSNFHTGRIHLSLWVSSVARCSVITSFCVLLNNDVHTDLFPWDGRCSNVLANPEKKTQKIKVKLFRVHAYVKTMYFWFHKNSHDSGVSLGILSNLLWVYHFGCDVFKGVFQFCTREGVKFRNLKTHTIFHAHIKCNLLTGSNSFIRWQKKKN